MPASPEIIKQNERAFAKVKAECQDRKCEFWLPDGCTYEGRIIKGLCKRKYMQQCWEDKKKRNQGSGIRGQGSAKPTVQAEPAAASALADKLEQPVEEQADDLSLGKALIAELEAAVDQLDPESIEELYKELQQLASEQMRPIGLQALWYIKKSLKELKVTA